MAEAESLPWFDPTRVPQGSWPFLSSIWNSLRSIQDDVVTSTVDLAEGLGAITITGRLETYRQLVVRRALDLAQSTVVTWNKGLAIGAAVSARALLETLAAFHELLAEATLAAQNKNWDGLSQLIDAYVFSTSEGPDRTTGKPGGPPSVGKQVIRLIRTVEPEAERFWHQISDISHPNGKPMLRHFGVISANLFKEKPVEDSEPEIFQAIYNCLYLVCWFDVAMSDFDSLLDSVRYTESDT